MTHNYRNEVSRENHSPFEVNYKFSNLWISVDTISFSQDMLSYSLEELMRIINSIEKYIESFPIFKDTLQAYEVSDPSGCEEVIVEMTKASYMADVGPMASVAGAVAQALGRKLKTEFSINDIIVENGGDVYIDTTEDVRISVLTNNTVLPERIKLNLQKSHMPLGVCSSSGIFGHSFSKGKADVVVAISHNAAISDAFATAICNQICSASDIEHVLYKFQENESLLGVMAICEKTLGMIGQINLL